MSWHYLQEQGEDFSLQNFLDGIPSAQLKSKNIPEMSCSLGSETDNLSDSQSGTTLEHLTENLGEIKSISSQEDFPVKTYPQRVQVKDLPEPVADYGKSMRGLLEKFSLNLPSLKTHLCLGLEDLELSCKTLPKWGMTLDGACWELGTSLQITFETECGYLPTPCARDWKDNGRAPAEFRRHTKKLAAIYGGKVNPMAYEWMMGWPIGWTELKPLEMDKFQQWQQQHGIYCQESEAA